MGVGRLMIAAGLTIAALGLLVVALERLNIRLGRLPGDIAWHGRNTTFFFPWVTCLILSALGTLVVYLMNRGR